MQVDGQKYFNSSEGGGGIRRKHLRLHDCRPNVHVGDWHGLHNTSKHAGLNWSSHRMKTAAVEMKTLKPKYDEVNWLAHKQIHMYKQDHHHWIEFMFV